VVVAPTSENQDEGVQQAMDQHNTTVTGLTASQEISQI